MATPAQTQPPSPVRIFATLTAHEQTAALKTAIELEVFTAISEGATTAQAIAQRCGASERGVRILCDFLTIHELLLKEGSSYRLTPDSATFLDQRSPAYLGSAVKFMASPDILNAFKELTSAVRKGGTAVSEEGFLVPENPVWVEFARSMPPMVAGPADAISKLLGSAAGQTLKVLDIAAGHGLFGIAIAKANPQAQVVALDWASVLEVAQENAQKAGVAKRFNTIPGSAFDAAFGDNYDVVLLTNFLHHFDVPTCENLLRKVHAALKPGGRVATLEFVPNEDRVSPPLPAMFSMMMLSTTARGDAYTFSEFERMFRNAGFGRSELHDLPMSPQRVIVSYK
jgi:2-polyprenyl-3-methyl-5-hydroxy-6-metoxy-1,4-benzoquinol methylase